MEHPSIPPKTTPRKPRKQEIDQSLRELKGTALPIMPSPLPNDPAGRRVNNTRDLANTDIVPEDDGTSMTVATAFP